MQCYVFILANGGRNSKQQENKLQSKGHNYLTGIMHYWKQREVLSCASHYMRGVKSCKIMSVSTGLNCLCAGYWNPAEKSIKGIMAFAASGRFLLLVPERRAVRESRWRWWLVSARGYCRHMVHSTDGKIRHQWQKTENVSQWHVCHKLWFLPLSNEE